MAAAADVMPAGEIGELEPGRRGHDHFAGIRVPARGECALDAVGNVGEQIGRHPRHEACFLAVTANIRLTFDPEDHDAD